MKKILIIDDSKTQLTSLRLFLGRHNLDVITAENGIEGYKKIIECPPDIVVCDVLMPTLNGYQFCRLLKNNPLTQKIPIILLTSLNQNIDRFWGHQAGADLFISKNCELTDLVANINKIITLNPVEEGIKKTILNTPALKNALQAKINDILDTSLMEATIMNEFRKLSKNIEDTDKFLKSFFVLLSSLFNYNFSYLYFYDNNYSEKTKIYVSTEGYEYSSQCQQTILKSLLEENIQPEIQEINTEKLLKMPSDNTEFKTKYFLELDINGTKVAKICLCSYETIDYESFQFFEVVKNEIALMAKIWNLYTQTKYLSITDGLTMLYNRRYFFENIEREFIRAERYNSPLSAAMLDIDFFKKINDTYGHQAGDSVLKFLSETITAQLRKTDLIFRYGGEEIIILLPETTKEQASIPLERLRKYIENSTIEYNNQEIKFTVSIGLSEKNDKMPTYEELVYASDEALYKAKNSGRNRIVIDE